MNLLLEISSGLCLLIGCFLCFSGGIGIIRFPDFYTRMHAASVTDTLGTSLVLIGLMLLSPNGLVIMKLILMLLCTLFINPYASHALAKAALHNGMLPLQAKPDSQGGDKPSKP